MGYTAERLIVEWVTAAGALFSLGKELEILVSWKRPSPKAWKRYWTVFLVYDLVWLAWYMIDQDTLMVGIWAVLTLIAISGLHMAVKDARKEKS